jgi:iduronate 2-sulfatase
MGYSIRTSRVRYTEWRDWQSGRTVARELYDAVDDPAEMTNLIDSPRLREEPELAAAQQEAAHLLSHQFPPRAATKD